MEETTKLFTGQDYVFAEILSKRTAIIKSISLNYEFGLNDLVLFDPNNMQVMQVVKKNSNTVYVKFNEGGFGLIKQNLSFEKLKNYFFHEQIQSESLMCGVAGLSIPINLSDEDFEIILHNCPVNCELITQEDGGSESIEEDEDEFI